MKTCLVLGAGASLANALHFRPARRTNTRPPLDTTFFQVVQGRRIALTPALRSYMRTIFRAEPTPERLRTVRMEEFFKDLFFDFQDSPGHAPYRRAYTDLVDLYMRIIRDTTNWLAGDGRTGAPVGRLLTAAADESDVVTVLTFNHDLVIENEICRRAHLRRRWCLDRGYGTFGASLATLTPGTSRPLFPVHASGGCDHTHPIRILKLHGSLNWVIRLNSALPTARTLSGEAGPRTVYLYNGRQVRPRTTIGRPAGRTGRGRTTWNTWPVLIPPVYAKQALRRRVQQVWQDARTALDECDRIVFFGYSLPHIDVEAQKLFERGIAANSNLRWADVINPDPASAQRFASLAPVMPIRWYPSLASFAHAGAFK